MFVGNIIDLTLLVGNIGAAFYAGILRFGFTPSFIS